jgi:hypothetical protein
MKKRILSILLLLSNSLIAFEPGQLSLDSVSNFEADDAGFTIRHRFFGKVSESEKFFGIDDGANTLLGLRYAPLKNLIFEVHHTREKAEYNARVGYAYKFDYLHTQFNLNAFSFKENKLNDRRKNIFANLVLQTPIMFEHLILTTNIGYDNYYEKIGAGLGVELNIPNFINSLTFTESLSILGEIYTNSYDIANVNGKYNAYAYGIKFSTFQHHFELLLSNSTAMDPRTMMLGTDDDSLHFAFNINRKF